MIDFPIVDAHVHFWDPDKLSYPWLADIPFLNKPYLLEDYNKTCGRIRVEKMVFVQCECDFSQYKEEVDWAMSLAQQDARIEGVVPWAPLEKGDAVRPELEALAEKGCIKGIRRIILFEPDVEFCLRPDFIKGVQALPDFNMHFEICIAHFQIENAIKFARQCANVRFILDHIGMPGIKAHNLDPWRAHLGTLAAMPNVCCKMSGLVTEADRDNWTKEDLKPYVDHVIECFGFDRVIYGGDWPVALQASEYPRWVETLEWGVQGCSESELRRLFHDNAVAFYRLDAGTASEN